MSVPTGYKATGVGVIPEDWDAKPLKSLNPFITSGSRGWAKYYADVGDAFVRITNLSRHNIYPNMTDLRRVKLPVGENEGTRTGLRNGDVLVSITADIGIIGYVDDRVPKPAYINQHIATVRVDPNEAESKFLSYFLSTEGSQRRVRATTDAGAKAGMSLSGVGSLLVACPPTVTEQTAIAQTMSDMDEAIAAIEAVITKKRALKTASTQALLSGTRRLPGFGDTARLGQFKQSEVGVIPQDWDVVPLGIVGPFSKGRGIRKDQASSGDIPCVRYGELYTDHNDVVRTFRSRISTEVASTSKLLSKGDLLFAASGETKEEIGKCVAFVHDIEAYAGGDIVILSPQEADSVFLGYLLNAELIVRQKAARAQGDMVVHISARALAEVSIPLPPIVAEQAAIAKALSDMDEDIAVSETRLAKLRSVRSGMMQQLLTGKIRLV